MSTTGFQVSVAVLSCSTTPCTAATSATVTLDGNSQLTGLSGTASFSVPASGSHSLTISAPGYEPYSTILNVASYSNPITVTLVPITPGETFTSTGAVFSRVSGNSAFLVSFTNNAASSESVNVWLVWYNQKDQVVSIWEQVGVAFQPGQTLSFTVVYYTPGTYTVKTFVTDANFNALSPDYSTTVTV